MFGSKKTQGSSAETSGKSDRRSNSNTAAGINSACVIVNGTVIEGNFKSPNDTRMDGVVIGNVSCGARMIMGQDAKVEGNIQTKSATISGIFSGELQVQELLQLGNTAQIDGIINVGELEMAEGAILNGTLNVGSKQPKAAKG